MTQLAPDPDSSPVQLHELLRERQAKPRTLLLPGGVPADLAKLLEDRGLETRLWDWRPWEVEHLLLGFRVGVAPFDW